LSGGASRPPLPFWWRALAVTGMLLLLGFVFVPLVCQASEDAIILYQYSANLATTGVISFIPHGPRAEGATDFLWMMVLAAGRWLGLPSYGMAIVISAACVVALAAMLVRIAQLTGIARTGAAQRTGVAQQTGAAHRRWSAWNLFAVIALVLLVPQTFAADAGFSVFAFALLLAWMAYAAYAEMYGQAVIAALLLCLTRPDGVVFAVPLLAVYMFREEGLAAQRVRQTRWWKTRWWKALLGFVVPGLAYFAWRWHYFGHLLPLPFYVKSDTPRIAHVLVLHSAVGLAPPLLAACALVWIALRREVFSPRNRAWLLTLLLPSSLFYLTLRLDQNYANRFFLYPLVIAAVLLAANFEHYRERAGRVLLAGLGVWAVCLAYFWVNWMVIYTLDYPQPREVAVARELARLPVRGTMIVSESGAIPFYSQWAAYDPWGLNTPAFALHLIQPDDVKQLNPDLVIIHQDTDPLPCAVAPGEALPHEQRSWRNMTQNVFGGIENARYSQWLLPQFNKYYRSHPTRWNGQHRFGVGDYQCWFVRNDSPESAAVAAILRRHGAITAAEYREGQVSPDE
jgi:hypothetical protein